MRGIAYLNMYVQYCTTHLLICNIIKSAIFREIVFTDIETDPGILPWTSCYEQYKLLEILLGPFLPTWLNLNPNVDNKSHTEYYVEWN